jgi:hypothetical protein
MWFPRTTAATDEHLRHQRATGPVVASATHGQWKTSVFAVARAIDYMIAKERPDALFVMSLGWHLNLDEQDALAFAQDIISTPRAK